MPILLLQTLPYSVQLCEHLLQYAAKLHGEKVKRFLHKNNGKLGTQYFRPRQAAFETSEKLSGYPSGSVTPVGLKTPLPIILSHEIAKLQPDFFWMGGGEELLKWVCMYLSLLMHTSLSLWTAHTRCCVH